MNLKTYRTLLSSDGKNLSEIKKNQSNQVINNTFLHDPNYKKVYVLTTEGWQFVDAKYQFHTAKSILRDDVDYYLQFRPGVHFPIGSYVIVPDDTSPEINLSEDELLAPFTQPIKNRTQWWVIVDKNNANNFVRHNILKCNWEFKWIRNEKICSCFGIARSANSYTSGKWTDEFSSTLDNLTNAWLPDIYHVYGNKCTELGMDDNRTIMHEQRFILSNNILDPKVYQVTKITDLSPQGIIKLSLKQDEYNSTRDNLELNICDYYTSTGELETSVEANVLSDECNIARMTVNASNELEELKDFTATLSLGESAYFAVNAKTAQMNWQIQLVADAQYEKSNEYYENLIKMEIISNTCIMIKPSKAKSLLGKKFILSASDYTSIIASIELEVVE